jgi:hypothetical protein
MSKIMAIVCGLFLLSTAASAQRFNAFVGYSHIGFGPNLYSLQLDPLSPPLRRSKNGWNASLEAKVLPVLGIVADFSGYYGNSTANLLQPVHRLLRGRQRELQSVRLHFWTAGLLAIRQV